MFKKQKKIVRAQQVVCAIVVIAFVVSILQMVNMIWRLSASNVLGSWYLWYGALQFVPLVVCAVLWLVARGTLWERAYQALVLSTAALFAGLAFSTVYYALVSKYVVIADIPQEFLLNLFIYIVPQLIFTAIFAVLLRRQKSVKKTLPLTYTTLALSASAFFAATILDTMLHVVLQYPSNQNLSAFVTSFVSFAGVLLIGGAAVFLERNRGIKQPFRAAAFITTFGVIALYNVMYLISLMYAPWAEQWLLAFCIMFGSVSAVVGFRWLYRTLRVLD